MNWAMFDGDQTTFWSAPVNSHHAVLETSFAQPVRFSQALTMERLNNGQHIEHYRIEAWDGRAWKTLVEGHAIGHKRIDHFPAVTAARVRLNVLSATAEAEIREFQLFFVDSR